MIQRLEEKREKGELVLSYSRSNLYGECGLKYKFKYVDKIPEPSGMALIFGSAVHLALEKVDEVYKESRTLPDIDTLVAIFEKQLTEDIPQVYSKVDDIVAIMDIADHKSMGRKIIEMYLADVLKRDWYDPKETEREIFFESQKTGVAFMGYIDWLGMQDDIVDRKTSKDKYKFVLNDDGTPFINPKTGNMVFDGEWTKKVQLFMYVIWFRTEYMKVERNKMYDVMVKPKTKTRAALQVLDVIVTEQDIIDTMAWLNNIYDGITAEDYRPNPSYKCKWCSYRKMCSFAQT